MSKADEADAPVVRNPWSELRRFTPARIALGRSGVSLPTQAQLAFQQDHALARDAVHHALDVDGFQGELMRALELAPAACVSLRSAARDRAIYLRRPDLGRTLDPPSRAHLLESCACAARVASGPGSEPNFRYDLGFVIADGLSARAIERHVIPLLQAVLPMLRNDGLALAPFCQVQQGRVAIGDEIGELLRMQLVAVLIGERPGLSSPDSLGAYLTWNPRVGLTDESRNCISNIRDAGLSATEAAAKLHYLVSQARRRGLTGVALKDETGASPGSLPRPQK